MVILDATIVNVALPSIQTDLGMSESGLQWVVNAYALLFGGFLLLGGRAGDLIGRKRVFLAGLVLFTVASLLCGFANGETWLIVARGAAGARRGARLAGGPLDRYDDLQGRAGAGEGARRLGGDRRRRRRRRAAARRDPRRDALLAVDLLRQRAGRDRDLPPLAPLRAGVEGRARAQELRPRRRRRRHRRAHRARLRDRALGRVRLGLRRGARHPRRGRRPARRVRPHRAALGGAARPSLDLLGEDGARRQRRDVRRRGRALRDVLLQHALRAARARLLAARGGSRVPPVHARDHHRRRARPAAAPEARPARGARDRVVDRRCRAAAVPAALAGQHLPRRPAAGDHARPRSAWASSSCPSR